MDFGLKREVLKAIIDAIKKFPEIEKVKIYGSRALGNYKKGSDIDIALYGDISLDTLSQLKGHLEEETLIPYFFDLTIYKDISKIKLKEHIDLYGKELVLDSTDN